MDFDLDDPLGDLLSDDSNDSFFQITKKRSAKAQDANPLQSGKHTTKVGDLFGIGGGAPDTITENTEQSVRKESPARTAIRPTTAAAVSRTATAASVSSTNVAETSKHMNPSQTQANVARQPSANSKASTPAKHIAKSNSTDDLLGELGFDPKNSRAAARPKSNIIDDILNFGETVADATATNTSTYRTPAESKSSSIVEERPRLRGADKSMRSSKSLDLLGTMARQSSMDGRSNRSKEAISKPLNAFDWLGLGTETAADDRPNKELPQASGSNQHQQQQQQQEQQLYAPSQQVIASHTEPAMLLKATATTPAPATLDNNTKNSSGRMETALRFDETIVQTLHQQANQLQTTISMKQQENVLIDMHRKQQSLIEQQERQFNDLIQRQSNRQMQLETQIEQQQQQIHSYINTLLQQPSIGGMPSTRLQRSLAAEPLDASQVDQVELKSDVKRLELDKLRLEDTLENIRSTHDQEMELVKGSHKKQIELYEESLAHLEQRLQNGLKYAEDYHTGRYNGVRTDIEDQRRLHEEQTVKMRDEYEDKLERMRSSYVAALDTLKNDQLAAIKAIRETKLIEFATVQDGSSYLHTLKSASSQLSEASENLQSMRTNMETNVERLHIEKEAQLNAKEQRLNDQQRAIDKLVEKTELERTQLIDLVRTLEMKLASAEQSSSEQQWMFRQKSATLDAERVSFEREKTFVREKQEAEEKRIKVLEEKQYAEYKRLMDIVDADRESVWSEKSKLQTLARLQPAANSSTQRRQIELDAAIEIAQDASKSADAEREKFIELQRKFEVKRRELIDKEKILQNKEFELDTRVTETNDQKRTSERAVDTCKTLEQKLQFKLRSLQNHHAELVERENRLSEAKIQLSANRMEVQRLKQRLQQSRCSLCRVGAQNHAIAEHGNALDDVAFTDELPPDIMRRMPANIPHTENDPFDNILRSIGGHSPIVSHVPHFSIAARSNGDKSIDPDALLLDLNLHTLDVTDYD